jgi:hypothetical protein
LTLHVVGVHFHKSISIEAVVPNLITLHTVGSSVKEVISAKRVSVLTEKRNIVVLIESKYCEELDQICSFCLCAC